jgi:hypothetical protein
MKDETGLVYSEYRRLLLVHANKLSLESKYFKGIGSWWMAELLEKLSKEKLQEYEQSKLETEGE